MNIDVLKVIVLLIALIYFNRKLKGDVSQASFWMINIGLFLILFAAVLDYCDGLRAFNFVPILGKMDPVHDFLEDQIGDTLGLLFFITGTFRELIKKRGG